MCELVHGPIDPDGNLLTTSFEPLAEVDRRDAAISFAGTFTPTAAGPYGVTARVRPVHPLLINPVEPGHITWAG